MARTPEEIQTQMNQVKQNYPELQALNSPSATAIYNLWVYITAVVISLFENLMDLFKANIQDIIDHNQFGTAQWWYKQVLAFQYGSLLAFIDNIYQYPAIDTTQQIVKYCSIDANETSGIVHILVAKDNGGQPAQLTDPEVAGLVSYCRQIRPAGIRFNVLSSRADQLVIDGNIYYDASANIDLIKQNVTAAITNYITGINATNFNGTLYVNKLIDAVQAVPGLVGNQFDFNRIQSGPDGGNLADVVNKCQPVAGYFAVPSEQAKTLTLTYNAL